MTHAEKNISIDLGHSHMLKQQLHLPDKLSLMLKKEGVKIEQS